LPHLLARVWLKLQLRNGWCERLTAVANNLLHLSLAKVALHDLLITILLPRRNERRLWGIFIREQTASLCCYFMHEAHAILIFFEGELEPVLQFLKHGLLAVRGRDESVDVARIHELESQLLAWRAEGRGRRLVHLHFVVRHVLLHCLSIQILGRDAQV